MEDSSSDGVYKRLLPDVALPSAIDSGVNHGLAFCLSGSTPSKGCTLVRSGGSSGAAALFAGIAALVAEKNGAQGNLAPNLYTLSRVGGVFNDVEQGKAQLPCVATSPGCGPTEQIGFAASTGFDLATGLGSVDALALVNQWNAVPQVGTGGVSVSLSISPQQPNNTYNPSALVTLAISVSSQTGGVLPTGTITLVNSSSGQPLPSAPTATLDGNGNASLTLNLNTIFSTPGSYNIAAKYNGDSTYKVVTSPALTITTEQSFTLLTVLPSTSQPTPGETITVTVTAGVLTTSGPPAGANPPTGLVTLNLTGGPTSPSYVATLNTVSGTTTATFSVLVPAGQPSYSLQATYAGDANYGSSTSTPVTITLTKGATTSSVSPATASPYAFSPLQLTATITPTNASSSLPSGTFTFTINSVAQTPASLIPGNPSTATLTITTPSPGNYTLAGSYGGDSNYSGSSATSVGFGVQKSPTTVTVVPPTTSPAAGATFQVTLNLTPQYPGSTLPTGNVTVTVDGTGQTTAALVGGTTATVTLTAPSTTGQHNLQASYAGDTNYSTSTSASVAFVVAGCAHGGRFVTSHGLRHGHKSRLVAAFGVGELRVGPGRRKRSAADSRVAVDGHHDYPTQHRRDAYHRRHIQRRHFLRNLDIATGDLCRGQGGDGHHTYRDTIHADRGRYRILHCQCGFGQHNHGHSQFLHRHRDFPG
jgi:hypothetical protein